MQSYIHIHIQQQNGVHCDTYICWMCNLSMYLAISHWAKREMTRGAVHIDAPRLDSSVVEHLAYIQGTWVQSPVWPYLGCNTEV
jgi:hypothetical protein